MKVTVIKTDHWMMLAAQQQQQQQQDESNWKRLEDNSFVPLRQLKHDIKTSNGERSKGKAVMLTNN